jgi:hypothetical protein
MVCGAKVGPRVETKQCNYCRCFYLKSEKKCPACKIKKDKEKALREQEKALRERDWEPVSAVLVATQALTETKKSAIGAAGRAVVGGALLGPIGALAGAVTTRSKTSVVGQSATFSVKYASGRVGTETVYVGGERFNELAALLVK